MAQLHHGPSYYDWSELTAEVEKNTGKEVRNWAGHQYQKNDPNPYWDFWHKFVESYDISNGRVEHIDFDYLATYYEENDPENYEWIKEICEEFKKVLGPPDQDNCYPIMFEW